VYTTPHSFGVALMCMATGIAYAAILRGYAQMHKEWMVRSYLVTFAFVTFRVITDHLPGLVSRLASTPDEAGTNATWLSWTVPLVAFELIL